MNVRLSKEQKIKILNSADVYNVMQQILLRENKIRRNQEHFWIVGLDNKNKIQFIELVSLGSVNRVHIDPPEVFRLAIYKLAVKLILVHNHPSGQMKPSKADLDFTDRMLKVGKLMSIEVIDHFIISESKFISFAEKGILAKLEKSGLYEIIDREKASLKEWKIEVERDQAKYESQLRIARKLIKEGMDERFIKKVTGLTLPQIRRL